MAQTVATTDTGDRWQMAAAGGQDVTTRAKLLSIDRTVPSFLKLPPIELDFVGTVT